MTIKETMIATAKAAQSVSTIALYSTAMGAPPFLTNATEKGIPIPSSRLKRGPPKQAE